MSWTNLSALESKNADHAGRPSAKKGLGVSGTPGLRMIWTCAMSAHLDQAPRNAGGVAAGDEPAEEIRTSQRPNNDGLGDADGAMKLGHCGAPWLDGGTIAAGISI
jgi:hypothetical protein